MLGRPHHVLPLLQSIVDTSPGCDVFFALSSHDDDVIAEVDRTGSYYFVIEHAPGDYSRKINKAMTLHDSKLYFTGASDLRFHPGWFDAAAARMIDRIGVVGTNDLGSPRVVAGEHATHMLVSKEYVDHFGTIDGGVGFFHEGYSHEFCDDEAIQTARFHNAWAMALDSHVEHLHPSWGKGEWDASYSASGERMARDELVYRSRMHLWGQKA